jgi:hypothetical protein
MGEGMTLSNTGRGLERRGAAWWLVTASLAASACGNGTMPAQDSGLPPDVVRPPNSRYCPLFNETDGGVLRIDSSGNRTTSLMSWPILCHPNMRPGDPCVATRGSPGRCRDFDYESSGRFSDYTRFNRVALYCRREGDDPCNNDRLLSQTCESYGNCVEVPDPLPGRPRFVCFPPVCNP